MLLFYLYCFALALAFNGGGRLRCFGVILQWTMYTILYFHMEDNNGMCTFQYFFLINFLSFLVCWFNYVYSAIANAWELAWRSSTVISPFQWYFYSNLWMNGISVMEVFCYMETEGSLEIIFSSHCAIAFLIMHKKAPCHKWIARMTSHKLTEMIINCLHC